MKSTINIIAFVALIAILAGCGQPAPKTLKEKKALLQAKKQELLKISAEINKLEAEITKSDPAVREQVKRSPVGVIKVEEVNFQHFVNIQGKVEANNNILVSPVQGGRVIKIYPSEGQYVKKGQLLAQLDDAIMRRSIEEVQTSLDLANIMFEKQKRLWDQQIGTEVQYLTSKNQKEALEKRLATLEEQLDMSKIKAPISGTVDEIMPKVGETVSPGFPAFRIVNNADLSFNADLSESYIPYIKRGDLVKLNFPTIDKTLEARVSIVGQSIDPNNRTFKVEIKLPADKLLKSNMFGEVAINDQTIEKAIMVPLEVVQQSEKGPYIFIVQRSADGYKWKAYRKNIETGLSDDGTIQVKSGLSPGEQLVIAGYKDLSDGQEVVINQAIANN